MPQILWKVINMAWPCTLLDEEIERNNFTAWGHCIFTFKTSLTEPDQPSKVSQSLGQLSKNHTSVDGSTGRQHYTIDTQQFCLFIADVLDMNAAMKRGAQKPSISSCDLVPNVYCVETWASWGLRLNWSHFYPFLHPAFGQGHIWSIWRVQSELAAPRPRATGTWCFHVVSVGGSSPSSGWRKVQPSTKACRHLPGVYKLAERDQPFSILVSFRCYSDTSFLGPDCS